MMGLVLSIAVLLTGTIVQTAEAGKIKVPSSKMKLSCNDRKDMLTCKVTSRSGIDSASIIFPELTLVDDKLEPGWGFSGSQFCESRQPFPSVSITSGNYTVTAHECGPDGGFTDTWNILVVDTRSGPSISDIKKMP